MSTVSLYNVSLLVCDSDISEVNNAEGVECSLSVFTMPAFGFVVSLNYTIITISLSRNSRTDRQSMQTNVVAKVHGNIRDS